MGLEVKRMVGVCSNRQQRGDSVGSKTIQSRDGCVSRKLRVCFVHKAAQIRKGWHCFFPEGLEGEAAPLHELAGSCQRVGEPVGEREPSFGDPHVKLEFPSRRRALNPFYEERNTRDTDLADGVCCFVAPVFSHRAGGAQYVDPVAEGMSIVRRFCGRCVVCEEGNKDERRTDEEEKNYSLLAHAQTLPRRGALERAN